MVNIIKRMRRLKELLDIRLGPGAMIMKPEVQRIHMHFATRMNDGHMGPRKFWRHALPRLKYHNPAVAMTVTRTEDQAGPASLTVYFSAPGSDQAVAEVEEEKSIDMKNKTDTTILEELTRMTDGREIQATEQEEEEMQTLREQAVRSERDAELQRQVLEKKRREQEILEQARRSAQVNPG